MSDKILIDRDTLANWEGQLDQITGAWHISDEIAALLSEQPQASAAQSAQYRVTFYYLATGMEGRADERDYGVVDANSEEDAIEKTIARHFQDCSVSDKSFIRGCLKATREHSAQSAPAGAVHDGLPLVIAGAIFDFAGFLTTREGLIEVGATANASPVAGLIQEWAELRGLSLADAAVLSWQDLLAAAPAQPAAQGEFGDAYQGAREDLAIWKRRALEAEEKLRKAEQSTPEAIEVIGYASPGQVEIVRSLPRTGGMKVKGCKDGRYTEPVVLLSAARAALFAAVIRCEQAGAFKTCMECGYQDGHDEICKFHYINRAAQDQGEVQSRERWTVMCGHWQDTTLAIHGERTGHIASGIDEDAARAIVNAHNQGLPSIAAAITGQEV